MTATSPLARWEWREAQLPNRDVWSYVEIPLDLDGAVTLTATIAATLPRDGATPDGTIMTYHERGLVRRIEDSLDGESWFCAANGIIYPAAGANVTRISSPLGTVARLAWWTNCVITRVKDGGEAFMRDACSNKSCGFDHSTLIVTDVVFNIGVRSI